MPTLAREFCLQWPTTLPPTASMTQVQKTRTSPHLPLLAVYWVRSSCWLHVPQSQDCFLHYVSARIPATFPVPFTSLLIASFHSIPFDSISFHFISFHFISFDSISFHFISFKWKQQHHQPRPLSHCISRRLVCGSSPPLVYPHLGWRPTV